VITPATVSDGAITAVWSTPFVAAPSSFLGLCLLLALIGFFLWDQIRRWWYTARGTFLGASVSGLLLLYAVDRILGGGLGVGMFMSVVMLVWFGGAIESRWGTKRLLVFATIVITAVNVSACLIAWRWPGSYAAVGGRTMALIQGTGPLVTALITVWCLMYGRMKLAILNVEARKLVWVLIILGFLDIIFVSRLKGLMDLLAIATAWLLVSGLWRPRHLLDRIRLWLIDSRIKRRRGQIRIVDDDRKLH